MLTPVLETLGAQAAADPQKAGMGVWSPGQGVQAPSSGWDMDSRRGVLAPGDAGGRWGGESLDPAWQVSLGCLPPPT